MFKASPAIRLFFAVVASVILLGIWLTGFKTVHWLLYLPMAAFYFAALTGICPGLIFTRMIFKEGKAAA